ncbi:hypothetical protein [unidentified bacterial endosymbiont]|uniref:hypothetical protein n=1 Tax=unidentified bacterial endosymbiont TaxID=2355 RepID=UPI00209D7F7B|nr:hypothetical protein [unidentified bacterial endosymbiont]
MNIAILRVWSSYHRVRDCLSHSVARVRKEGAIARFRIVRKIPLRLAFLWAHARRSLGLYGKAYRLREQVAIANQRCLLPNASLHYTWTAQRRELLEFYATWGQSPQLQSEIERCAELLGARAQALVEAGKPLIFAPLHMTSDVVSVIVASKATSLHTTVVVSSNASQWNEQARALGKVDVDYCSVESSSKEIGLNLATACMDVAENKRDLVVFADMVPDYTFHNSETVQDKLSCHLFGRPAYLHSGLLRLAKVTKANILFFYLYYDRGLQISIFPGVEYRHASIMMPQIIEQAITESPNDWLLWHRHCLYFLNEG